MSVELLNGRNHFKIELEELPILVGSVPQTDSYEPDPMTSGLVCRISRLREQIVIETIFSEGQSLLVDGISAFGAILKPGSKITLGETSYHVQFKPQIHVPASTIFPARHSHRPAKVKAGEPLSTGA